MLHKNCFNVSNRWYAPDLGVSKMAIVSTNFFGNGSILFFFSFCNLSESGFLESCRKSQPSPF